MAHLLMYSTNYTVCRLSACLRPHALRVHLQHHMIGSACQLSLMCDVRLPQALAEALTTSAKGMAGHRLLQGLQCSDLSMDIDFPDIPGSWDPGFSNPFGRRLFSLPSRDAFGRELLTVTFESHCNLIVSDFKVTWDEAKKVAVDAANAAAAAAAATATTLLNEAQAATRAVEREFNDYIVEAERLAREAAAAATQEFNDYKAEAERLAREAEAAATQFIDDVGNAFGELGDEIQCAHPPPPPATLPPFSTRASHLPSHPVPLAGVSSVESSSWSSMLGRSPSNWETTWSIS